MLHSSTDSPIVTWPCYEPAGHRVELTEAQLVQHLLLIGSTGSGKSALLTAATTQLILHRADNSEEKLGLLVLDAKDDEIAPQVRQTAHRAGRDADVLVFGPGGDHGFDLFGALRSLDDVDRMTRRILSAAESLEGDNSFWQMTVRNMFSAAFTLWLASRQPVAFEPVIDFLRRLFLSPVTPPDLQDLAQQLGQGGHPRHPLLSAALDQLQVWQELDSRTRSNVQCCLLNVLRPLMSPAAVSCFAPRAQPTGVPSQAATDGKLCVVSVNALAEPELAKFFFRLAQQSFFEAVQERSGKHHRLVGLVGDELPLVVSPDDVEQLATVRSKRCFVMAATQGLQPLNDRIGGGPTRALVNNFNNIIFLRTREAETAVLAHLAFGMRKERLRRNLPLEEGFLRVLPLPSDEKTTLEIPVCPLGALAQLDVHQAFVTLADGTRSSFPIWFRPWFDLPELESAGQTAASTTFTAGHVRQLMAQAGFKPILSARLVKMALEMCRPTGGGSLERAIEFFRSKGWRVPTGLDRLPDCWLAALPGILWQLRQPSWTSLPFFINRLAKQDGMLLIGFVQEQPNPEDLVTAWDKIRVRVNASLYPSCWRPLTRRHFLRLCSGADRRPEVLDADYDRM